MIWYGTPTAVTRAKKYCPAVSWKYHSDYMQQVISRAYSGDKARAMYRTKIGDEEYLVGSSLTDMKEVIRFYKSTGRDMFMEVVE